MLQNFKADEAVLASLSGVTAAVKEYVKNKPIKLISLQDIILLQKTINND